MNKLNKWEILAGIVATMAIFLAVGFFSRSPSISANGTVPVTPSSSGQLFSCSISPTSATMTAYGNKQSFVYTAYDINSSPVSNVSVGFTQSGNNIFGWSGQFATDSSGQASVLIEGSVPAGANTLTATGTDPHSGQQCAVTASITVLVATPTPTSVPPPAAATPTAVPTPSVTPTVPAGTTQKWVDPNSGGSVTGSNGTSVSFPPGSLSQPAFAQVQTLDPSMVSTSNPLPGGFKVGSSAVDISFTDANGNPIKPSVSNPVTITFHLTQADIDSVLSGNTLTVLHYDSTLKRWVQLAAVVDFANKTATVTVTSFSPYVLAYAPATGTPAATATPSATASPTPTPKPPPTGDVTPGSGLLILLGLVGGLIVLGGGYMLRRTSKS